MDLDDLPEDSDTSDDDYVPEGEKTENVPSEEDSDGDVEEPLSESEDTGKRRKKRRKTGKARKKQKVNIAVDVGSEKKDEATAAINENEKKKKEEDIWADFMKDTGFQSKNAIKTETATKAARSVEEKVKVSENRKEKDAKSAEKVRITQIFEFAGEEVKVEKEVASHSAEARLLGNTSKSGTRGSLSGIGSVLSQLGKKQKISTLEKSKLDWDRFKKEENIEEELQTYNKGKNGYLDRQDFLQRADLRRFEIEKDIRSVERNKRFNNTL